MFSFFPKKTISKGSSGIQADGDLTINYGLTASEVEKLVKLFLKENFPQLREDAMLQVQENIQKFLAEFEKKLTSKFSSIDINKLSDPDVQFLINDATIATARYGEKANIHILTDLILQKLTVDDDLFSITINQAVQVVQHLSKDQLNFLSVLFFFQNLEQFLPIENFSSINDLEPISQILAESIDNLIDMPTINHRHLEALNCIISIPRKTIYRAHEPRPGIRWKIHDLYRNGHGDVTDDFNKQVDMTNYLLRLIRIYESHHMEWYRMTNIGLVIGAININNLISGKLDVIACLNDYFNK